MVLEQFDQETVKLVPDKIIMQSPKELTQYFIQTWSLRLKNAGNVKKTSITSWGLAGSVELELTLVLA